MLLYNYNKISQLVGLLAFSMFSLALTAQPTAPTNVGVSANLLCPGGSANLSASVPAGYVVKWYTAPTGGTPVGQSNSGANFSVTPTATTTYYAETSPNTDVQTFSFTGGVQYWTVPTGITSLNISAKGARGYSGNGKTGGLGGWVVADRTVTAGQVLNIYVGGQGGNNTGGYNGGGSGKARGGGATDIRIGGIALSNRVLVAGGGGAASHYANGGAGGGLMGSAGNAGNPSSITGGSGGTASAGGAGGVGQTGVTGANGAAGTSGNGGQGGFQSGAIGFVGGNGGGGFFGGGGGGALTTSTANSASGGGGSSFTDASCSNVTHTQGNNSGHGSLVVTPSGPVSTSRIAVTIIIVAAPANLLAANSTPTGTDLAWASATGAASYDWKVVLAGAGSNGTAVASGNTVLTGITVSGLSGGTAYEAYVRSVCGAGGHSGWSAAHNFSTSVPITPPTITPSRVYDICGNAQTLLIPYTNAQNNPTHYTLTSDIPNFTDVDTTNLPANVIAVDLSGATLTPNVFYNLSLTIINTTNNTSTNYAFTFRNLEVPTQLPATNQPGVIYANAVCMDTQNWLHYINTVQDRLLLSVQPNGWDPGNLNATGTPGAGEYSVKYGTVATANDVGYLFIPGGTSYVTNSLGWYVFNQSWDVLLNNSGQQPGSPVNVRSYYHTAQYDSLNAILVRINQTPLDSQQQLLRYHFKNDKDSYAALTNSHATIDSASIRYYYNTQAGSHATGVAYAEFGLGEFSKGGGIAAVSGGGAPVVPAIPTLNVPAIINACAGDSVTISATAGGGLTVRWFWHTGTAGGPMDSTDTNPLLVLHPTTRTYYAFGVNASGQKSSLGAAVRVNRNTFASTNDLAGNDRLICPGLNTLLGHGSNPGVSGWTYSWYPAQGLSATNIARPTAQAVPASTTYNLQVTNQWGCKGNFDVNISTHNISGLTAATNAGPDQNVCAGSTISLGDTAQAGFAYFWASGSFNQQAHRSLANPSVNIASNVVAASGLRYVIQVTDSTNGCVRRDTAIVIVRATPSATRSDAGADISLVSGAYGTIGLNNGLAGFTYSWVPTDGLSNPVGATTVVGGLSNANMPANGFAYTRYTIHPSGCMNYDSVKVLIVPIRVADPNVSASFQLYPNPTQHTVFLNSTALLNGEATWTLTSADGRQLATRTTRLDAHVWNEEIDLSAFPAGIYILETRSGTDKAYFKLIKE